MSNLDIRKTKDADPKTSALAKRIRKEAEEKGSYDTFLGVFGDDKDCAGVIENTIYPKEGGILTKLYGCSFLYKGRPMNDTLENISYGKALISQIPREIIAKSFLLKTALGLLFVFARKRFVHYAARYAEVLYKNIVKKSFSKDYYNTMVRELRRDMNNVIVNKYKNVWINENGDLVFISKGHKNLQKEREKAVGSDLGALIRNISEFVFFFIEYDNAYRFRLQDVLEEIDKKNAKKNIVSEINRLFDILIKREYAKDGDGIAFKWIKIRKIVIPFLRISKNARRMLKEFILDLDINKVSLDENDWYFCLNRKYNFKDISLEERLKEKKKIDIQKGHIEVIVSNKQDKNYVQA